MAFPGFITLKDFFNYYISGFIWIVAFALCFLPFETNSVLIFLEQTKSIIESFGAVIIGLILLIIPFTIGFVFTPFSMIFTDRLLKMFGDPKKWVFDYPENDLGVKKKYIGKRLSKTNRRLVTKKLNNWLCEENSISEKNISKWFFQIQAIVINSGTNVATLVIRAHDLANLAESLLLPLPILQIVLFFKLVKIYPIFAWIFLVLGILFFVLLSKRYINLRTYWIKHTYRAFLAIKN